MIIYMTELRTINFDLKHFECEDGKRKFTIKEVPSFERYRIMQKVCLEFGFSASFIDIYNNITSGFELLNKMKPAEGAVVLHNILKGMASAEEKYPAAFRLCALFIDEEGEDPAVYDEGKMNEKIECWGKELSPLPFFNMASELVIGWMPAYKDFIQNGLPQVAKVESF